MLEIVDQAGTSGSVIVEPHEVAEALRPWFPEAPAEVTRAIDDLQDAIARDDHAQYELAEYLAITISPVTEVELDPIGTEQARYLADTTTGVSVDEDGTVTITAAGLSKLAELPEDVDGHYDGKHIWIGGTEYAFTAS